MSARDTTEIKEKILSFIKLNGPTLPIQISREIKMDSIFASAFLSELLSQNKLKITKMKVGGSPLYYLENSKHRLEKPAEEFLKSKEKEAFLLLKEKKELIDSVQETAIRVALRSIKDFAIPDEKEGELVWRYFIEEKKLEIKEEPKTLFPKSIVQEVIKKFEKSQEKDEEKITEKPKEKIQVEKKVLVEKEIKKERKKEISSKKKSLSFIKKTQEKKNELFFNTVKEYLKSQNYEIIDIIGFTKGDLTLIIKNQDKELLLIAYNKKRLTEIDIINANKKTKNYNMKYIIFNLGEPAKKTSDFIEAIKNLSSIEKI